MEVDNKNKRGFTLIELIITIVLIGIVIIPSSIFLIESIKGAFKSEDIMVAVNLARMELERLNNVLYTDIEATIASTNYTPYAGYNYDLLPTVNELDISGERIKEIKIEVYPAGKLGSTDDLLTTVITNRAENVQYL